MCHIDTGVWHTTLVIQSWITGKAFSRHRRLGWDTVDLYPWTHTGFCVLKRNKCYQVIIVIENLSGSSLRLYCCQCFGFCYKERIQSLNRQSLLRRHLKPWPQRDSVQRPVQVYAPNGCCIMARNTHTYMCVCVVWYCQKIHNDPIYEPNSRRLHGPSARNAHRFITGAWILSC